MEKEKKTENAPSPGPFLSTLSKQRFPLSFLEIVFGSLIILGLIYIGYVIFFQDSSGTFSRMEKRIKNLETALREQGENTDKRIKAIQDNQAQWEARLKALENANQGKTTPTVKTQPSRTEEKKPPSAEPGKKKYQYKVKKGDTLQSIAARYKVTTGDLLQWNKRSKKKPIRVGETLTILSR